MLLDISHETTYRYRAPVNYSVQYLRLTPRTDRGQRVLNWRLDTPGRRWAQRDAFGNITHTISITEPHDSIRISIRGTVETREESGYPIPEIGNVPVTAFLFPTTLTTANAAILELASLLSTADADRRSALLALAAAIESKVRYVPGTTDAQSTAVQALEQGSGVCQDHAHIFIACCRAAGIPARYVSGYLFTGEHHLASHAWAEAWSGDEGWIEIDITNSRLAGADTCRLAVGRDYRDASPVRGVRQGGGQEELDVVVRVRDAGQ